MLTIHVTPGDPLETNCYLVADAAAGQALLVDAPWHVVDQVQALAAQLGVTIRLIVCTHGHWDHTMGLAELTAATGAPVACHPDDAGLLEAPSFAPFNLPFVLTPCTPSQLLREGDAVAVGGHTFTVLHTPGHTPGGICLYDAASHALFTGDTLFADTCGRMDLPGGDPAAMVQSLLRLRALPPDTAVYPGHGRETTIGAERWLSHAEEIEEY